MLSADPRALQTPLKLFWCTKQYEDSNSPSRRDSFSTWAIGSQRCAWGLDVTYMMGLQFQDIQALEKDHRKGNAYTSSPAPTEDHQRLLQASFFLLFHKGQSRLSGIKTRMGLLRLPALLPCLRRFWGEKADYFLVVPWPTDVRNTGEEGRFRFVLGIFPLIMFSTKRSFGSGLGRMTWKQKLRMIQQHRKGSLRYVLAGAQLGCFSRTQSSWSGRAKAIGQQVRTLARADREMLEQEGRK